MSRLYLKQPRLHGSLRRQGWTDLLRPDRWQLQGQSFRLRSGGLQVPRFQHQTTIASEWADTTALYLASELATYSICVDARVLVRFWAAL